MPKPATKTIVVQPPTEATLRRYGLTEEEWAGILKSQGGVCAICEKVPSTGRFVIDHDHVRGWKKMPPERRKLYVRGITCWYCNGTFLSRGVTAERMSRVVSYLRSYAARAPQNPPAEECDWFGEPAELAWAAGLFEGEGSITHRAKDTPALYLRMTDEDVVVKFASTVDCGAVYGPYQRGVDKAFWQWQAVSRADVARVLTALSPWFGERRMARAEGVLHGE